MKSAIVRLEEYLSQASAAEKNVVEFYIRHPEKLVSCSIKEVSAFTYASAATIVRLCRKLGFSGYRDFQKSLLYDLALRRESQEVMQQEIQTGDSLENLVAKVTIKNIISLENTSKLIETEVLKACVDLVEECHIIYLFGLGSSLLVAHDANLKFLRVNKPSIVSDDWHVQLLQARNMNERDLAIAISYSGFTEEVVTCAKTAKENGAKVISISRFEQSPLVKIADYNLPVAATELIFRSGAMSSRISQLNVIDILYTAYVQRNYDTCMQRFKKTHIRKSCDGSESIHE